MFSEISKPVAELSALVYCEIAIGNLARQAENSIPFKETDDFG